MKDRRRDRHRDAFVHTPVGFIVEGRDGVAFEPIAPQLGLSDLLPVPVRFVAKRFRLL